MDDRTPQELALAVMQAYFEDDPGTVALLEQMVTALQTAGLLIDPVDNGIWQNLKLGYMQCWFVDGQLSFRLTEAGKRATEDMLNGVRS